MKRQNENNVDITHMDQQLLHLFDQLFTKLKSTIKVGDDVFLRKELTIEIGPTSVCYFGGDTLIDVLLAIKHSAG